MRGVVVGVSGSAEAEAALDWALTEAASRQVPLTAVLAWTGPRGVQPSEYQDELERRREDLLGLLDASCRRTSLGLDVSAQVVEGDPTDALLNAGEDADLLVLGRRRRGRLGRLVLGSVSSEVVERAEVPVTVVRVDAGAGDDDGQGGTDPGSPQEGPARVVVGVDTSGPSVLALQHAAEVAARTGAVLDAVFAWQITTLAPLPGSWGYAPPLDEYEAFAAERLDEVIAEAGVDLPEDRLVRNVVHRSPATALIEASAGAERVVVGARGLGGFDRLLLGSVSRQVLEYASAPVTVVR
ncbi:universal stress protein [Xylanimonas oleitrophica]|uniref:Universal stress protein n=1 Tax=Xylanimonas oleitrophica TaxID=2607479 RepID=A0A2W5WND4_9MICO|nr:universal stress protein [Xylanimonas oleitrophica]PZR52680.1 universal stress protein [Xylanimonas oleitrophica]